VRYLFEDFALDTDRRELCRAGDVLPIAPQVFDLLVFLIRNRERFVSKDELIAGRRLARLHYHGLRAHDASIRSAQCRR
jgi:DNA-binding winged helix-turn-helix (wHTH) protein